MIQEGRTVVRSDDPGTAYVTREDWAAAAAAVLAGTGHENLIYEITGPALVRRSDIAEVASEVAGVGITTVEVAPGGQGALPEIPPSGTTLTTHFQAITGRPGTSLRDLVEASREALLAARR